MAMYLRWIIFCILTLMAPVLHADQIRVAVASNFIQTIKQLSTDFTKRSDHQLSISSASTGKLFAQIINGAPYDVFLSADEYRADLLVEKGLSNRSWVYASGQLVFLAEKQAGLSCQQILRKNRFKRLAIASPKTAPYGLASQQVLIKLGLWDEIRSKRITGENIAQSYQFIISGNVDAAFIAASQFVENPALENYCHWLIPANLFQPIRQKMVGLRRAEKNIAVKAFIDYMKSEHARAIIRRNGYLLN